MICVTYYMLQLTHGVHVQKENLTGEEQRRGYKSQLYDLFLQPFQHHSSCPRYHLPWWCVHQDRCHMAYRCHHPPAWASCPSQVRWCLDRAVPHRDYLPTSSILLVVLCQPPCLCQLESPCLRLVWIASLEPYSLHVWEYKWVWRHTNSKAKCLTPEWNLFRK